MNNYQPLNISSVNHDEGVVFLASPFLFSLIIYAKKYYSQAEEMTMIMIDSHARPAVENREEKKKSFSFKNYFNLFPSIAMLTN